MLLQNKTAVVTGCNRGIGKKILEVFSANGATVFSCVRNISEEFKSNIKEIEKNTKNKISQICKYSSYYKCLEYFRYRTSPLCSRE